MTSTGNGLHTTVSRYNEWVEAGGEGGRRMSTEEELGYRDAMRQVTRSLQRRLKGLEDELHEASDRQKEEIEIRVDEINHLLHTLDSLHR